MTIPSTLSVDVDHPPLNGSTDVTPAARTPGIALSCGRSWFVKRICDVSLWYFTAGSARLKVSTFFGSNPGSTPCSFATLRINSPAPTSSVSDNATSATTSARRTVRPAMSDVPLRLPSLSVS
jgi:hypothetical protein